MKFLSSNNSQSYFQITRFCCKYIVNISAFTSAGKGIGKCFEFVASAPGRVYSSSHYNYNFTYRNLLKRWNVSCPSISFTYIYRIFKELIEFQIIWIIYIHTYIHIEGYPPRNVKSHRDNNPANASLNITWFPPNGPSNFIECKPIYYVRIFKTGWSFNHTVETGRDSLYLALAISNGAELVIPNVSEKN